VAGTVDATVDVGGRIDCAAARVAPNDNTTKAIPHAGPRKSRGMMREAGVDDTKPDN